MREILGDDSDIVAAADLAALVYADVSLGGIFVAESATELGDAAAEFGFSSVVLGGRSKLSGDSGIDSGFGS